jgi:hypothetical protein
MNNSRYAPEIANAILERVSSGEPLRQVCRDEGMPPESTFRQWVRDDRDGLAARYEAARRSMIDCFADEIVLLANRDDLDANDKHVRIDTLKWLCSKVAPRRYGERLLVAGDSDSPLQVLHKQVSPSLNELSTEALDALQLFCEQMMLRPAGANGDQHAPGERRSAPLLEHEPA